jgi:hypothetical protein
MLVSVKKYQTEFGVICYNFIAVIASLRKEYTFVFNRHKMAWQRLWGRLNKRRSTVNTNHNTHYSGAKKNPLQLN